MTEERDQLLLELQTRLSYVFCDTRLLEQALTHRSFVHENPDREGHNNERMEFLGDAILGFLVSDMLVRSHVEFTEGQLSRLRASLVNERSLSAIARMIDLGLYIHLGRGEEGSGGRMKPSILSDALEAVVAAIYLDGGLPALTTWFNAFLAPLMENNTERFRLADYKTVFQQVAQKEFRGLPTYHLIGESGPDHFKLFQVRMTVGDMVTEGTGRTKKEAEQEAARKALALLVADGEDIPQ
jgi:ribonuclease III